MRIPERAIVGGVSGYEARDPEVGTSLGVAYTARDAIRLALGGRLEAAVRRAAAAGDAEARALVMEIDAACVAWARSVAKENGDGLTGGAGGGAKAGSQR